MSDTTTHALSFSEAQMDEFVAVTSASHWIKEAEVLAAKLMSHVATLELCQIGTISTDARLDWEDIPWLMWSFAYDRRVYPVSIFDDEVVRIYDAQGREHACKKFSEFSFPEILAFAVGFFWVRDLARIESRRSWDFSSNELTTLEEKIQKTGWDGRVTDVVTRSLQPLGVSVSYCETLTVRKFEGFPRQVGLVGLRRVYQKDIVVKSQSAGTAELDDSVYHVYRTSDLALVCAKPWREFSFAELLEFCSDHLFVDSFDLEAV